MNDSISAAQALGLFLGLAIVIIFATVCWFGERTRELLRQWRRDRAEYRRRAEEAAKCYRYRVSFIRKDGSELPVGVVRGDSSSLLDDTDSRGGAA